MLNKIQLIGNLGGDPETRRLESGKAVARFNLATKETWKDANGKKQESTEWHTVIAWEKLAELAERLLKKGNLVYVEGKMTYRNYEDDKGQKRYYAEVRANTFRILNSKREGDTGTANAAPVEESASGENPADDLPF